MNSLEIFWISLICCGHLGITRTFWIVGLFIFALLFKMPRNKHLTSSLSCKDSMSYLDSSKLGVAVVCAGFVFTFWTFSLTQQIRISWVIWHSTTLASLYRWWCVRSGPVQPVVQLDLAVMGLVLCITVQEESLSWWTRLPRFWKSRSVITY